MLYFSIQLTVTPQTGLVKKLTLKETVWHLNFIQGLQMKNLENPIHSAVYNRPWNKEHSCKISRQRVKAFGLNRERDLHR